MVNIGNRVILLHSEEILALGDGEVPQVGDRFVVMRDDDGNSITHGITSINGYNRIIIILCNEKSLTENKLALRGRTIRPL